jgi:transcriptional regulator with XRE-family HTH domain
LILSVRGHMRRKRWSLNQLADFSGIGRGYLSDVLAAKKSPTVRTLVKLADALEIEVSDLFDRPSGLVKTDR